MPVYTVMAEAGDEDSPRLHNTASSSAIETLRRVSLFRRDGFKNIRVYREVELIDELELRRAAAAEA